MAYLVAGKILRSTEIMFDKEAESEISSLMNKFILCMSRNNSIETR